MGRFFKGCVALAAVLGLYLVWWLLAPSDTPLSTFIDDALGTLVPIASGVACWTAARREPHLRPAWRLLASGLWSWGAGQAVWTYYQATGREVPFPSLADVGYLAMVPLVALAILAFHPGVLPGVARFRPVLDGLVISGALLTVGWVWVLGPIYRVGGDTATLALGLAYPIGDIVIATVLLLVLTQSPSGDRLRLGLLAAGVGGLIVGDLGFVYATTAGTYTTGALTDWGWLLGFGIIGLSGLAPAGSAPRREDHISNGRWPMLPYGLVGIDIAVIVGLGPDHFIADPFLFYKAAAVCSFVVARQLLAVAENNHLTQRLEAHVRALGAREAHFRSLVRNSSSIVTVTGADGRIRSVSDSVVEMLGCSPRQLMERRVVDLVHPDDIPIVLGLYNQWGDPGSACRSVHLRWRHACGDWVDGETSVTNLLDDPSVNGIVLNTRDITDRVVLEQELQHRAFHDELTGLANRAFFLREVEQSLAGLRKVGVLFVDLDDFKGVNDSLGHAVGDELLVLAAQRLRNAARSTDTVARLGGDEFAVLIEGLGVSDDADQLAARITEVFREPFALVGREVMVRSSVGIALGSAGEVAAEELLRNADLAMYSAKSRGKGCWTRFQPVMHQTAVSRLELDTELRRAVEEGHLEVHYQPFVRLHTDRVVAAEALVRWRHPTRGMISPDDFIPQAEANGLILAMGRMVLADACQQVPRWAELTGEPLSVSVNVSPRQLREPSFVSDVADCLVKYSVPPRQLILEITESMALQDFQQAVAQLQALRALGVRLALDDFGTGYSSLAYLRRLPLDILKIDRTFTDAVTGTTNGAMVATIVELSRALGLETVAEGVETECDLAELRALGCDLGQGWLLGRPVPAADFDELLLRRAIPSPAPLAVNRAAL